VGLRFLLVHAKKNTDMYGALKKRLLSQQPSKTGSCRVTVPASQNRRSPLLRNLNGQSTVA
jgi:hypothetical protein